VYIGTLIKKVHSDVRPLTNRCTEFHRTSVDNVVEGTHEHELVGIYRSKGQGHRKVIYSSELLLQSEAYTR